MIPSLLLKRAASGQLALLPAATRLMQEALSGAPLSAESGADGVLAEEKRLVEAVKKVALLVAGVAYQKYMAALAEQQ